MAGFMHMRHMPRVILAAVLLLATASYAPARDFYPKSKATTPVEVLRAMKAPVVPSSVELGRAGTIEIKLTDANRRTLIVHVGGARPPTTVLEMLNGTPRDDVTLKLSTSGEGFLLEMGGNDEAHILHILQVWRAKAVTIAADKSEKSATNNSLPPAESEQRIKLVDSAIALLRPRHQRAAKPASRARQ